MSRPIPHLSGFIDIPYEQLKKALEKIEAKKGICKVLPSARFSWLYSRIIGGKHIQVGENMPNLFAPSERSFITFECLICDRLGGDSVGTSAENCRNCVLFQEQKNQKQELVSLKSLFETSKNEGEKKDEV